MSSKQNKQDGASSASSKLAAAEAVEVEGEEREGEVREGEGREGEVREEGASSSSSSSASSASSSSASSSSASSSVKKDRDYSGWPFGDERFLDEISTLSFKKEEYYFNSWLKIVHCFMGDSFDSKNPFLPAKRLRSAILKTLRSWSDSKGSERGSYNLEIVIEKLFNIVRGFYERVDPVSFCDESSDSPYSELYDALFIANTEMHSGMFGPSEAKILTKLIKALSSAKLSK